jgi:predicted enzyme related to lactoylglutathione lyase
MAVGLQIGWLTIDTRDPKELGSFWKEALDLEVVFETESGDEYALSGKGRMGSNWNILFYRAPDEKKVKNRLHLDLIPDTDQEAEVKRLEQLGARRADIGQQDVTWVVMADPEGNEFCVLSPRDDVPA